MKLYDKEMKTVEFDIAVTVEDTNTKSGNAGIRVLQFAEAVGDIAEETKNSIVSRVKFGVHIGFQTKEEVTKSIENERARNSQRRNQSFI